jgi:hypothetical protein
MPPTLTPPLSPVVPEDVRAFAAARGAADYLGPLLELARQSFPGAAVTVLLEDDPEIAGLRYVVFEVDVGDWDAGRITAAYDRWTPAFVDACPPAVSELFVLGMR